MGEVIPAEPPSAGTWRQVAVVIDGKDIPAGRGTLLTVTPAGYTITVNGRLYQSGTSKVDSSASPLRSDATATAGTNAGVTVEQIFKIEGDVMVVCGAMPGAARPTAFTSAPGSGHVLSVWLRVPARAAASITPAAFWVIVAASAFVGGTPGAAVEKALAGDAGIWPALLARVLVSGLTAGAAGFVIARLWTADPAARRLLASSALLFGAVLPATLGVYENLRKLLEPEHGWLGWGLSLLAAMFVGLTLSLVLSRVVRWAAPDALDR